MGCTRLLFGTMAQCASQALHSFKVCLACMLHPTSWLSAGASSHQYGEVHPVAVTLAEVIALTLTTFPPPILTLFSSGTRLAIPPCRHTSTVKARAHAFGPMELGAAPKVNLNKGSSDAWREKAQTKRSQRRQLLGAVSRRRDVSRTPPAFRYIPGGPRFREPWLLAKPCLGPSPHPAVWAPFRATQGMLRKALTCSKFCGPYTNPTLPT